MASESDKPVSPLDNKPTKPLLKEKSFKGNLGY